MQDFNAAHILIVDDEPPVSELLSRWLVAAGYDCVVAESGATALKELETRRFDLALLDVMMPGMSGIDLMTIMKPLFSDVAVIFVTAVDDRDTAKLAADLGAYAYIIKPFERSEIMFAVSGALERKRLRSLVKGGDPSERSRQAQEARYKALIRCLPLALAEFSLQTPAPKHAPPEDLGPRLGQARISTANILFARSVGAESPKSLLGKTAAEVIGDDGALRDLARHEDDAAAAEGDAVANEARDDLAGDNGWRNLCFGYGQEDAITSFWVIRLPRERRLESPAPT